MARSDQKEENEKVTLHEALQANLKELLVDHEVLLHTHETLQLHERHTVEAIATTSHEVQLVATSLEAHQVLVLILEVLQATEEDTAHHGQPESALNHVVLHHTHEVHQATEEVQLADTSHEVHLTDHHHTHVDRQRAHHEEDIVQKEQHQLHERHMEEATHEAHQATEEDTAHEEVQLVATSHEDHLHIHEEAHHHAEVARDTAQEEAAHHEVVLHVADLHEDEQASTHSNLLIQTR